MSAFYFLFFFWNVSLIHLFISVFLPHEQWTNSTRKEWREHTVFVSWQQMWSKWQAKGSIGRMPGSCSIMGCSLRWNIGQNTGKCWQGKKWRNAPLHIKIGLQFNHQIGINTCLSLDTLKEMQEKKYTHLTLFHIFSFCTLFLLTRTVSIAFII